MKKAILTTVIILFSLLVKAQFDVGLPITNDNLYLIKGTVTSARLLTPVDTIVTPCPPIKLDNGTTSEWLPVADTTVHDWVYDTPRLMQDTAANPSGCPLPIVYAQRRIDKVTGFLQTQTIIYQWVDVAVAKSEFEEALIFFGKDE